MSGILSKLEASAQRAFISGLRRNAYHAADGRRIRCGMRSYDSSSLPMDERLKKIASVYRRFAEDEAHGRSPLYEQLATEVARDLPALEFLADLPRSKRQPNLLFAAVRYICGTADGWEEFRDWLNGYREQIQSVILKRRTQTNEPARCATLLPIFALLPQPLALLEIGASAGLCLIPDRYAYTYNRKVRIAPTSKIGVVPPMFWCEANEKTPIPKRNIEVVWRAGLDIEPVQLDDRDGTAWLEALVWPDENDRLALFRQALAVAREAPPQVVQGDLRVDLPALAAQAPSRATLVIFHSAVIAYVESTAERFALANTIANIGAVWISNEGSNVSPRENEPESVSCPAGQFLLLKNKMPIACTDPHGASIRWF